MKCYERNVKESWNLLSELVKEFDIKLLNAIAISRIHLAFRCVIYFLSLMKSMYGFLGIRLPKVLFVVRQIFWAPTLDSQSLPKFLIFTYILKITGL